MNATRTQRGFTIVEILVAVTISLFLLAGVVQVFVGSKQAYRTNEALGRVQESGRFALDIIARDVRLAGNNVSDQICGGAYMTYEDDASNASSTLDPGRKRIALKCFVDGKLVSTIPGCGDIDVDDPSWPFRSFKDIALDGYDYDDDSGTWSPSLPGDISALSPMAGDVITIRRSPSDSGWVRVTGHGAAPGTAPLQIGTGSGIESGDILMVVDKPCTRATIFQATNPDDDDPDTTGEILHTATGDDPGNRTAALGWNYTDGYVLHGLTTADAQKVTSYYIGTSDISGLPALFRSTDGAAGEEIVDGVEDMQIEYSTGNGNYDDATEIGDWKKVVAVRISLLVQSPEANLTAEGENQVLTYNGAAVDTSDRRLRQVFTTTIALRNRLP